jgi:hypothetical protein
VCLEAGRRVREGSAALGELGDFGRGKSRLEVGATKTKGDEGGVGSGGGR